MPSIGEYRASYLYLKIGKKERVLNELKKKLGEYFIILKRDEAIKPCLFGNSFGNSQIGGRLGDVILISKNTNYLFYPYSNVELKARYGGLNKSEMIVPFLVF